jgi:L-iditol 2-dehydrogenase
MPIANAARIQAPFRVTFERVELAAPGPGEALLDVLATGICGHDMEIGATLAQDAKPFGHEVCARVREVGTGVTHISPGDQVALESSSFCGTCAACRNARPDLCRNLIGFWGRPAMGFSDAMLTPARACVPAPGLKPEAAALAEPVGVAYDMVKIADIGMTDRVLIVGGGAIGLMALALVRRRTAGTVAVAERALGKRSVARELGADLVFDPREKPLAEAGKPHGGFHRVLVTAPPQLLPDAMATLAYEGICVYIGFDWGDGGKVAFDTTAMHLGKQQLRASFASPAVYLPIALDLIRSGTIPAGTLISHRFRLSRLQEAINLLRNDRETTRKVIVIPDMAYRT